MKSYLFIDCLFEKEATANLLFSSVLLGKKERRGSAAVENIVDQKN